MKYFLIAFAFIPLLAFAQVKLVVLGTVQDGGSPHIGCEKKCCEALFENPDPNRMVVSFGLINESTKEKFIFEATPDFSRQLEILKSNCSFETSAIPNGIFLTHAHIGHYTGLMYLGREAKGASNVPVYAMPKMKTFLETNGPWSQLVELQNIKLRSLTNKVPLQLAEDLAIIPFKVPHRDEYSETVGFKFIGPNKSALFIPDIDKWEKWWVDIIQEIEKVDFAFLDATFFDAEEIGYRDIKEIPHPFVIESIKYFEKLNTKEKSKIYFIHFNHTNPLLKVGSEAYKSVNDLGFNLATFGDSFDL